MRKAILVAIPFVLFLFACTGQPTTPTEPMPSPSATFRPWRATLSAALTQQPTRTATPVPPVPPTPTATLPIEVTRAAAYSMFENCIPAWDAPLFSGEKATSSDHAWIVFDCADNDAQNSRFLRVAHVDSNVFYDLPYPPDPGPQVMSVDFYPVYWTKDGNYLLLQSYFCCIDGPPTLGTMSGLYKLNVKTGEYTAILHAWGMYSHSISPDGKYLAYGKSMDTGHVINIDEFTGHNISRVFLENRYDQVGMFVWTPDSEILLVVAGSQMKDAWFGGSSYDLFLYTVVEKKLTLLVEKTSWLPGIYLNEDLWPEEGKLLVQDQGIQALLDIRTGQIIPEVTPTP